MARLKSQAVVFALIVLAGQSAYAQNDFFSGDNLKELLTTTQPKTTPTTVAKTTLTVADLATVVQQASFEIKSRSKTNIAFTYYFAMKRGKVSLPISLSLSKNGRIVYFTMNLKHQGANPDARMLLALMRANVGQTYYFAINGPRNLVVVNRTWLSRDMNPARLKASLRFAAGFAEKHRSIWDPLPAPQNAAHVGIWRCETNNLVLVLGLAPNGEFALKARNKAGQTDDNKGTYTIANGRLTVRSGRDTLGGAVKIEGTKLIWAKDTGGAGTLVFTKVNPQ